MNHNLLLASMSSASVFIADMMFGGERNYTRYVMVFLLTFAFCSAVGAKDIRETLEDVHMEGLSSFSKQDVGMKIEYHNHWGNICMKDAAEFRFFKCPDDEEAAKTAFCTAMSSLGATDPKFKAAGMIVFALTYLGVDMMKKYHKLNSILCEADYHYENFKFYNELYRHLFGATYKIRPEDDMICPKPDERCVYQYELDDELYLETILN